MNSKTLCLAGAVVVAAIGCTRRAEEPAPQQTPLTGAQTSGATITERDWELLQLGDMTNPRGGGGGRPVTLRLDPVAQRASGFAGCNRYSGPYVLRGDSLTFGPAISTKMACEGGMEVETRYLGSLEKFRTYQAADSTLTLTGVEGALARFRAAAPGR